MRLTEADFARNCAYLSRLISGWAGDSLTLPERLQDPADTKTVARFTDDVRGRLDRLDKMAGRGGRMSDLRERVAQAIYQEREMVNIQFGAMPDWDHVCPHDHDNLMAEARAAIDEVIEQAVRIAETAPTPTPHFVNPRTGEDGTSQVRIAIAAALRALRGDEGGVDDRT